MTLFWTSRWVLSTRRQNHELKRVKIEALRRTQGGSLWWLLLGLCSHKRGSSYLSWYLPVPQYQAGIHIAQNKRCQPSWVFYYHLMSRISSATSVEDHMWTTSRDLPVYRTHCRPEKDGGSKSSFNTWKESPCQGELFIELISGKSFCPYKSSVPLEIY